VADERLRTLERAAAQGDPDAAEALSRIRLRHVVGAEFQPFRELEERGVDLQAPANLSLDQERLLAADLEPLGERVGPAIAFVTQGHGPEVLDRVSREDYRGLGLEYGHEESEERIELLRTLGSPSAFVRLGLLYAAAAGNPRPPRGPEEWLTQVLSASSRRRQGGYVPQTALSCETLVSMVDYAQLDSLLVLQLFFEDGNIYFQVEDAAGIVELAERHHDYIRSRLTERYSRRRVWTANRLIELGIPLEDHLEELARVAGHGRSAFSGGATIQSELRDRYAAGIQRPEIRGALESALRSGTPDERKELAAFIGQVCGQASRGALERAARDRSPRVRKAALRALEELTVASGRPNLDLSPLSPPGPEAEAAFRAAFRDHSDLYRAWELICEPTPWAPLPQPLLGAELRETPLNELLDAFAQLPDVQLGHVCRAVRLTGRLEGWEDDWRLRDQLRALDALARVWFETHAVAASLSTLAEAWAFLGLDERILGKIALTGDVIDRYFSAANEWDCADYYRRYPETLRDGLGNVASGINEWRGSLLREVATIVAQLQAQPEGFPGALQEAFTELALASAKSTRARAQAMLADEGDWLDEALIKELKARRAGRACAAARWLAERLAGGHGGRVAAAEAGLRERLESEKREKVREALEDALGTLA
jgi:hypothetical protein